MHQIFLCDLSDLCLIFTIYKNAHGLQIFSTKTIVEVYLIQFEKKLPISLKIIIFKNHS